MSRRRSRRGKEAAAGEFSKFETVFFSDLAGGNDSITLLTYPGSALPQHAGLTAEDVRRAEHAVGLVVKPMLEISGDKPERWALFDDEMYDKKVEYMVGLIEEGHSFSKAHWGGGDAGDKLYVYSETMKVKKRKAVIEPTGPILKQRQMSSYYNRQITVDAEKFAKMEVKIDEYGKEIGRLRELCDKHERRWKKGKMLKKGCNGAKWRSGTKLRMKVRSKETPVGVDAKTVPGKDEEIISEEEPTLLVRMRHGSSSVVGGEEREMSGDGLDEREIGELGVLVKAVVADNEVCDITVVCSWFEMFVQLTQRLSIWNLQIDNVEKDGTGNMNEGDSVQDEGLYENEIDNGDAEGGRGKMSSDVVEENELEETVNVTNMGERNVISEVDAEGSEHGSENGQNYRMTGDAGVSTEQELSTDRRMVVSVTYNYSCKWEGCTGESMKDDDAGEQMGSKEENENERLGDRPEVEVEDVSDSLAPSQVKHRPGEEDEQLAALLLAKDQYTFPDMVPFYEDCDYPFFEKVLTANPSV
ncbi:unnamed protein product [Eruca vesicaria subsp. sativa]|uniref:Uncharacterized protein n=1 Tax=Eruca vesicaria subsp. sativa TaxID=29727 RepID=A0ABC8JHR5_ERUVS|nr:unnamed protein product [Eruca vesicaria subsp. sativa]